MLKYLKEITSTKAVIQFDGMVKNTYTGLVAGKTYFVDANGQPPLTPPSPPISGKTYIQPIGVAMDANVLKLNPSKQMIILHG